MITNYAYFGGDYFNFHGLEGIILTLLIVSEWANSMSNYLPMANL